MSGLKMLPNGLPAIKRFITDHNSEGKAIYSTDNEETLEWQNVGGIKNFALGYTTSKFPVNLNDGDDIRKYEGYLQNKPGITIPGGTVLRYVDLAPGTVSPMHRTVSLDYGVVLEGQIKAVLDSGEIRIMNRGDVTIQRATNHEWRNTSKTEWARLMFVLQESEPVTIGGKALGEDYVDKTALLVQIDADKSKHIQFLQQFLQTPSPNPPGDTREAVDVVVGYLKSYGITPDIVAPQEHLPNVVHEFVGGQSSSSKEPRLVLNGHIDVFPSGPESDWTPGRGPWSGYIDEKENRIYGRGAVDMKPGTVASIITYAYLYRYKDQLNGSLALTAVSDEETGGRWGSRYLLDESLGGDFGDRWKGDVMMNGEPSGLGTIRFGEKGTLRLTITVRTKGAHGAYLHISESSTITTAEMICDMRRLIDSIEPDVPSDLKEYMNREEVREAVDEAIGKGASKIILKPTLNIGKLNGGLKVNMIPDTCILEADVRLPIGLLAATVLKKLREDLIEPYNKREGVSVELAVQQAASNAATSCSHTHPMIDIMAKNAEEYSGVSKAVAIPSMGATDCKFWRRIGVPAYNYGVAPETMGARDENTNLDHFMNVVKVHVASAWDYLGGKS